MGLDATLLPKPHDDHVTSRGGGFASRSTTDRSSVSSSSSHEIRKLGMGEAQEQREGVGVHLETLGDGSRFGPCVEQSNGESVGGGEQFDRVFAVHGVHCKGTRWGGARVVVYPFFRCRERLVRVIASAQPAKAWCARLEALPW